jgi:hypothetical protein
VITVPAAADEIEIPEPEPEDDAKEENNFAEFKPLARAETHLRPVLAAGVVLTVVLVIALAFILRGSNAKSSSLLLGCGAVVLAPLLVLAGYTILRNQELEPYQGAALAARVAVCATVYAVLWGVLWGLKHWLLAGDEALESWSTLYLLVPPLTIGSAAAWATLDLDLGSGFFHYCLYLGACVLLRLTMGLAAL